MPDEIWVGYYPDDGYTGESFDADIFDDGHNRTRYIKAPTNEGDVAALKNIKAWCQKRNFEYTASGVTTSTEDELLPWLLYRDDEGEFKHIYYQALDDMKVKQSLSEKDVRITELEGALSKIKRRMERMANKEDHKDRKRCFLLTIDECIEALKQGGA